MLDDALRKGGVIWLDGVHARWFAWFEQRVLVVFGPDEQPDPGLVDGGTTSIVVRARDANRRIAELDAAVRRVLPGDDDWAPTVERLAGARLNLSDREQVAERWASPAHAVYVLTPELPPRWHA